MYAQTNVANSMEIKSWCSICKKSGHTAEQHKDLVELKILKE